MNWWQIALTIFGTLGAIFLLARIGEKRDWLFLNGPSPWKKYDDDDEGAKGL